MKSQSTNKPGSASRYSAFVDSQFGSADQDLLFLANTNKLKKNYRQIEESRKKAKEQSPLLSTNYVPQFAAGVASVGAAADDAIRFSSPLKTSHAYDNLRQSRQQPAKIEELPDDEPIDINNDDLQKQLGQDHPVEEGDEADDEEDDFDEDDDEEDDEEGDEDAGVNGEEQGNEGEEMGADGAVLSASNNSNALVNSNSNNKAQSQKHKTQFGILTAEELGELIRCNPEAAKAERLSLLQTARQLHKQGVPMFKEPEDSDSVETLHYLVHLAMQEKTKKEYSDDKMRGYLAWSQKIDEALKIAGDHFPGKPNLQFVYDGVSSRRKQIEEALKKQALQVRDRVIENPQKEVMSQMGKGVAMQAVKSIFNIGITTLGQGSRRAPDENISHRKTLTKIESASKNTEKNMADMNNTISELRNSLYQMQQSQMQLANTLNNLLTVQSSFPVVNQAQLASQQQLQQPQTKAGEPEKPSLFDRKTQTTLPLSSVAAFNRPLNVPTAGAGEVIRDGIKYSAPSVPKNYNSSTIMGEIDRINQRNTNTVVPSAVDIPAIMNNLPKATAPLVNQLPTPKKPVAAESDDDDDDDDENSENEDDYTDDDGDEDEDPEFSSASEDEGDQEPSQTKPSALQMQELAKQIQKKQLNLNPKDDDKSSGTKGFSAIFSTVQNLKSIDDKVRKEKEDKEKKEAQINEEYNETLDDLFARSYEKKRETMPMPDQQTPQLPVQAAASKSITPNTSIRQKKVAFKL